MNRDIVLVAMPFLEATIPSIQLATLHAYLEKRGLIVHSIHAYVKFFDLIGHELSSVLNGREEAEYLYYRLLYPEKYATSQSRVDGIITNAFKWDESTLNYVYLKLEEFHNWVLDAVLASQADIVAFSITYHQLPSSLHMSKLIKEKKACQVVFGGSRVGGLMGETVLKHYSQVDYVLDGEGEDKLYRLITGSKSSLGEFQNVIMEDSEIPEYSDYFKILNECTNLPADFKHRIILFYEVSRGCWWNRCAFCSSVRIYSSYREKSPQKIIRDLKLLRNKHGEYRLWFVGDCYKFSSYQQLTLLLKADCARYNIIMYSRCQIVKSYYRDLFDAGIRIIIVGIESFSNRLLQKMDKGCSAIQNIQCLKICEEVGIQCVYNLFCDFPGIDKLDYDELNQSMDYIIHLSPPESICNMELQYGSKVYNNLQEFGIFNVRPRSIDIDMYPDDIHFFKYDYDTYFDASDHKREIFKRVQSWIDLRQKSGDTCPLTYSDFGNCIIISDKRDPDDIKKYALKDSAKSIFIFCDTIKSEADLEVKFSSINWRKIVNWMVMKKIMYHENEQFLSLPINNVDQQPTVSP